MDSTTITTAARVKWRGAQQGRLTEMQPIQLEPGMRVRCVDALPWAGLDVGAEYQVESVDYENSFGVSKQRPMVRLKGLHGWAYASRFKPIVRVKAPTSRLNNLRYAVDRVTGSMSHIFDQAGY